MFFHGNPLSRAACRKKEHYFKYVVFSELTSHLCVSIPVTESKCYQESPCQRYGCTSKFRWKGRCGPDFQQWMILKTRRMKQRINEEAEDGEIWKYSEFTKTGNKLNRKDS